MDFIKRFKALPSNTRNLMSLGIIIALAVALPLFVWALTNLNFNQNKKAASGEPLDITLGEPMMGLPAAPVTIAMYSDFQCPYCKDFVDNTFSTILSNYPNDVKFVFKDYPILSAHPLAESAAIAGQCAFAQDKFWEFHDLLFAKQDTLVESDFLDFATQLNLDLVVYNSCYSNKETLVEVQDDMTEGNFKGVTGTPTFFVNGIEIIGAQQFSVFKAVIDAELAALNPTSSPTATSTSTATATATASPTATPFVEGEPNSCGGTCGSNYNCKANFYCYQGFCRNPICSDRTDCDCSKVTPTATAKATIKPFVSGSTKTASPKATIKSTSKAMATYSSAVNKDMLGTNEPLTRTTEDLKAPENMFWAKYALYIIGAFILIVVTSLYFALRKKSDDNIPHIMPPTNI